MHLLSILTISTLATNALSAVPSKQLDDNNNLEKSSSSSSDPNCQHGHFATLTLFTDRYCTFPILDLELMYGAWAIPEKPPLSYKMSEDLRMGERIDFRTTPNDKVGDIFNNKKSDKDKCGKVAFGLRPADSGLGWKRQYCHSLDPPPGMTKEDEVPVLTCVGFFAEKRVQDVGMYGTCSVDGPSG